MDMDDESIAAFMDDVDEANVDGMIKDLIFDEKKMVTCKSLSNRLNVPLEKARKHLERFLDSYRNGDKKRMETLHCIYYLSGDLKRDGVTVYKAGFVRDKNLEAAKSRLAKVSSCQLFSLQCADIKNVAMTLMADGLGENGKNSLSVAPISCSNAHRRATADLTQQEKSIPETQSKYFDQEKGKVKSIDQQKSISAEKSIDAPVDKQSEPKSVAAKPAEAVKQQRSKAEIETTTKKNEKKRPTANSKFGSPSKKQATLTNFFKKP